jgi:HD-like signal output (HDOD) protein/CheY-like chemotaxis protein
LAANAQVKRVLFVDDEPNVLEGFKRALRSQREAWEMAFAVGADAAAALLADGPYDVVVTDMRMPGSDGATLLRTVCDRCPAAGRIILSGYTELEAAVRAAPVAHQFLLKPCDPVALRRAVELQIATHDRYAAPWAAALVGSVRAIPVAPRAYAALGDALHVGSPVDQLALLVTYDVGISAKVLQLANSAFFGRSRDVADIPSSVNYLGPKILRLLALTPEAEVFRQVEPQQPIAGMSFDAFELHSRLTGAIAARLPANGLSPQTLLLAGLLHDIGKLILIDRDPDRLRRAAKDALSSGRPLHAVETELYGLSHAELGAYLLGLWGLPVPIVEAVAYHHDPGRAGADVRDITAVVHAADALAHHASTRASPGRPQIDAAALAVLGGDGKLDAWQRMAADMAATVV